MRILFAGTIAAAALMTLPAALLAQSKTVTGVTKTETATVEAVEASTRTLTLKKSDGTYVETVAGPNVARFDEIKIGDKVTARYYENLVLRLKAPGEPEVTSAGASVTASGQAAPGGTAAKQTTITATIADIDPKVPSITFTGPNGWKYSSRVEDTKALAKVKVGDKVDITWTTAVLASIERVK